MALGEPEVRERLDLRVDVVGDIAHQAVALHAGVQLLLHRLDPLDAALGPHRAAEHIGILPRQVADGHAHLHELLLEDRDAEGALEHRLQLRMGVRDGLALHLAPHVRVHRPALDRPRPDERDLDHEIVEPPRLEARQKPHLRARLHLEDPDRIRPAQHVVDRGLLLRDRIERPLLPRRCADEIEAVLQSGEHAEPQQIELHEPHPRRIVLVPLDDSALLHARVLDRHDLADGALGEHHAAGVDAEVARRLHERAGVLQHPVGDVVSTRDGALPPLDLLRPGILLARRVPEGLRHVADGVLRPVLDDVRDLRGAFAAVRVEHPLDDLLASVRVEIDVDIWLLLAHRGEEPLERQVVEDRVDGRDVEQVADGAVGRRPAPLAQDAAAASLGDDPVHDEEVPRKVLLLDDAELLLDAGAVGVGGMRVLARHGIPHELPQPRHRRVPLRHGRLGQRGLRAPQRKGELVGEAHGARDRAGVPAEAARHLGARPQVRARVRREPAVELVEAPVRPHRGDRSRQVHPFGHGVVHVVRREDRQPALRGERGEQIVVAGVGGAAVVDEFDVHRVAPEALDEPIERIGSRGGAPGCQCLPHGALAASGQHSPVRIPVSIPVPAGPLSEVVEVVTRAPLLTPGELSVRDRGGEAVVTLLAAGEDEQMRPARISRPAPSGRGRERIIRERQLGSEHGLHVQLLGRLGETHDPVEPVVIGHGERVQTQPLGLFGELGR